jgi:hypothetical protein
MPTKSASKPCRPATKTHHLPIDRPELLAKVERWVQLKDVAFKLDVSEATLRRMLRSGRIMARRLWAGRGHWRIAVDARGMPIELQMLLAGAAAQLACSVCAHLPAFA